MTWRVDPTSSQTAEGLLIQLADRCNHASTWDSAGFSKLDTELGHSLRSEEHTSELQSH